MACVDVDMDIHGGDEELSRAGRQKLLAPKIQEYQATVLIPDNKGQLHGLLQKQPAVLGSLQVASGLFSVGVGIVFAVSQNINVSLFTLFRVAQLTGTLFIFAGVVSNLLFKYPALLSLSLKVNCGCIIVAVLAACLIGVDLAGWNIENQYFLKMELLALCVMGLEVFLSAILCFWFSKEKRAKSPVTDHSRTK
ncbi:hypothetical protein JOB18_035703 [Solea senegalensis]|nr:uncharacterized protein si:ch211-269k10.4 [Solea senegalensis]KAG7475689.1 hypothetical protein JOB18_035703 [Solea senegalensis]